MNENEVNKKNSDSKKITFTLILVLVLMITTTGGTYAYYALSATNSATVTGTAATANINLTVSKIKPTAAGTGVMVPQHSGYNNKNPLKTAIDASCIDGNNNIVCQVYTIVIQNSSTAAAKFNTTFSLSGGTFSNLRWYKLAEGSGQTPTTTYTYPTALTTAYGNLKTVTSLATNRSIAKNAYYYYVVAVWIEETGTTQNSIDTGTYTGTVTVSASDGSGNNVGGITSTFTS